MSAVGGRTQWGQFGTHQLVDRNRLLVGLVGVVQVDQVAHVEAVDDDQHTTRLLDAHTSADLMHGSAPRENAPEVGG